MQKHKWEKAESTLEQLLTQEKDSLFSDVYYAYSLLYSDTAYQHYQIDSAYHYILQAAQNFQQTSEKEREQLARRLPLTDSILLYQKRWLDSLAFARATEQSTVADYQHFIDQHADAPQREEAIRLRNQLAFEAASQVDTYQAYREFMDTYPQAVQVPEAQERYNTLVFQAQTKTGDLASYYQFLKTFPRSPYRPQAEQAIFRMSTASSKLSDYARFAYDFPDSPFARKAVNWLYHLYTVRHPADSFFIQYPGLPQADSLRQAMVEERRFLLPWLNQEKFGFINAEGNIIISPQYTQVLPDYLCEGVHTDLIYAAKDSSWRMLTKEGSLLYTTEKAQNELPPINDLGGGLIWIGDEQGGELVHKSGEVVIPRQENVAEASLIPGPSPASEGNDPPFQFIKFRIGDQWGLKTFTGTTLLPAEYDDIQEYNRFITLEQSGQLAVTNREAISQQIHGQSLEPDFRYEDVTLLDNDHLIAYTQRYEAVLDTALHAVVPLGRHTVLRQVRQDERTQWLLKTNEEQQLVRNDSLITINNTRYLLYPSSTAHELPTFSQVYYNDHWLALKTEQTYFLLDNQSSAFPSTSYDSVKIVSDHFAVIFHGPAQRLDSISLLIAQKNPIAFRFPSNTVSASDLRFRLIRTQDTQDPTGIEESLLVHRPDHPALLLSQTGDTVLEASLENIAAYPDGLYVIEQRGKKGVVDQAGNILVPSQYDQIGSYRPSGLLSIFHRQKFGAYHAQTSTLIKPSYESALQLYAIVLQDSVPQPLYIARKENKYGIIDGKEQSYLPFSFQAVRYWNDSSALVRYDDRWFIYPLSSEPRNRLRFEAENALYSGIEEYTLLPSPSSEILIRFYKSGGYGVLSNRTGQVLSPTFDDILLLRNSENGAAIYLTEKYVSEAELHILIHMDFQGRIIRREAYSPDEYDRLYCED